MGRLGLFPEQGVDFVKWLNRQEGLQVQGIFTHFARADEPLLSTTDWQIGRFQGMIDELQALQLRPQWVHACNSAGSLYFPQGYFDMVRSGIAVYGIDPSPEAPLPAGFRPAMSLKTTLVSIKELPAGYGVGYNHHYFTQKTERVGVLSVGYADGFRRRLGAEAILRGNRVPVLGTVCMDQCMVQIDSVPDAAVGDEVVLLGSQGAVSISAEDLGREWNTSPYEVVCGMSARPERIYVDHSSRE